MRRIVCHTFAPRWPICWCLRRVLCWLLRRGTRTFARLPLRRRRRGLILVYFNLTCCPLRSLLGQRRRLRLDRYLTGFALFRPAGLPRRRCWRVCYIVLLYRLWLRSFDPFRPPRELKVAIVLVVSYTRRKSQLHAPIKAQLFRTMTGPQSRTSHTVKGRIDAPARRSLRRRLGGLLMLSTCSGWRVCTRVVMGDGWNCASRIPGCRVGGDDVLNSQGGK